jgi:conjugal transfer pilus assembly protein TraV
MKIKTAIQGLTLFVSCGLFSGCSVMGTKFGCDKVGGINGCASVNQVYNAVEDGQIETETPTLTVTVNGGEASAQGQVPEGTQMPWLTDKPIGYAGVIPNVGDPVRTGESVQKVVIFPYEDQAGNYHEPAIIYTVLETPHWIAHPVKSIKLSGSY